MQNRKSTAKILEVRPLVEADLEYLRQPSAAQRLAKIRDSHHHVARLIASGLKLYEVAAATGYAYSRISTLVLDPSVIELVAKYRSMITEDWRQDADNYTSIAVANMTKAERMISDKLDEADEKGETLTMRELLAITADRNDRFGYGKKNMNVNVNVDFAAKLEAAISRSKKVA